MKPLIILGGLPHERRSAIYELLIELQAPVYVEAQSNLREASGLQKLILKSGARFLSTANFRRYFDSVIRIGSVPTLRFWRDLEETLCDVPVTTASDLPFTGLARKTQVSTSIDSFLIESKNLSIESDEAVFQKDHEIYEQTEKLLSLYSTSEPSLIRKLSQVISEKSFVMLGNSLPIREWDLAATHEEKKLHVVANRGANGIDGLIATFLGSAKASVENWLILGDLSALYDLNALAFTGHSSSQKLRVVVMNNRGGQIFEPMFKDQNFINTHELEFSKWAAMFGWDYRLTKDLRDLSLTDRPTVIEVRPDNECTQRLNVAYEKLFL